MVDLTLMEQGTKCVYVESLAPREALQYSGDNLTVKFELVGQCSPPANVQSLSLNDSRFQASQVAVSPVGGGTIQFPVSVDGIFYISMVVHIPKALDGNFAISTLVNATA
jgi:hypothetical protein